MPWCARDEQALTAAHVLEGPEGKNLVCWFAATPIGGFWRGCSRGGPGSRSKPQRHNVLGAWLGMKTVAESVRLIVAAPAQYAARLVKEPHELRAAQRLRFEVFNLELNEGFAESFATGRDEDPFDAVCDHLIVEHLPSGNIVGTYRLQTGTNAEHCLGYYSAQEFEFDVFERFRSEIVELGRACVHRQHRNLVVLGLLWKGIAEYAQCNGGRYLLGCSSLTSQDPAVGASAYAELCRRHLAPAECQTRPLPEFDCPLGQLAAESQAIPKLLRAYLTIGAKICGPPAMDREFKTIDFLTQLDLHRLPLAVRGRFFAEPSI